MVLGWFNAKEAEAFGNGLAVMFDEKFHANARAKQEKVAAKQEKLVAEVMSQARQYKIAHKLNAYQKAKLGNAFKWKLRDLGHDARLVDLMTKDLLLAMR